LLVSGARPLGGERICQQGAPRVGCGDAASYGWGVGPGDQSDPLVRRVWRRCRRPRARVRGAYRALSRHVFAGVIMVMTVRIGRTCLVVAALVAATLTGACSSDPETTKQRHLTRGREYFAQEKYAEAIIELRNAVQIDARFGEARYQLAEAYARTGD